MALPDKIQPQRVELKFGSGINTAQSETDIDPKECARDSVNFDLHIKDSFFSGRKAFDLIATTADLGDIRGFAQLKKQDGSLSQLVQSGANVYSWDGTTGFVLVGTVAAGARLRGHVNRSNWSLDEVIIITDIELRQPVMTWDGTTFATLAHNLTGDFYAKYCFVEGEAAWYANVVSGAAGVATPHLLARSAVSDYTDLSVADKPSSSLGDDDPFFLLTPDLRPINGLLAAFGLIVTSSQNGRIYKITGTTAKDMAIEQLYDGSGADGTEPMELVGNDIVYGRQGAIETVFSVQNFGDVAADDLSLPIALDIADFGDWTMVFNPRLKKVYIFSEGQQTCLVYHKNFRDLRLQRIQSRTEAPEDSPWAPWTTRHAIGFQPSSVMMLYRPTDGTEQVYMGGNAGEIFMLEGDGGLDGGTEDIQCIRVSKVFEAPSDAVGFNISGFISYRKEFAVPLTITLRYQGTKQEDRSISLTMQGNTNVEVFNGDAYFGGDFYFGVLFEGRLTRNQINAAGLASQFQIEVAVDGSQQFAIHKIQYEFPTGA